jgi:hypothetical protein
MIEMNIGKAIEVLKMENELRCNTIFGYAYEEDETEDMYYEPYCYKCGQRLIWR